MSLTIEEKIFTMVEVSKASGVPVLFVSNPGFGKTVNLTKWAKENGYHYESLIASRFRPDEISGFMVNEPGVDHLVHKEPSWFKRIWDQYNKNVPTLLFIDELSAADENVQAPLYTLLSEHTIGEQKKLPDNILIISAANYAPNMPSYCNITAPNLNRFCIINLLENIERNGLLTEFLQPSQGHKKLTLEKLSEEDTKRFNQLVYETMINLFDAYNDKNSSKGYLDIYNTDIGNIFQNSEGFLYNFFSGRSSYYLQNMLRACIELNVTNKDIIGEIASGLLGNGTNTFTDEKQAIAFRKALKVSFNNMMATFKGKSTKVKPKESKAETLADKIHEIIIDRDGALDVSIDKEPFIKVYSDIMIEYGSLKDTFAKFSKNEKVSDKDKAIFVSDMDAIEEYISCVKTMLDKNDPVVEQVIRVHQDHLSIYNMFMGTSIKISDKKNIYGSDYIDEKHVDIFVLAKVKDRLSGKSNLMKLSKKEAYNNLYYAFGMSDGIKKINLNKNIHADEIEVIYKV